MWWSEPVVSLNLGYRVSGFMRPASRSWLPVSGQRRNDPVFVLADADVRRRLGFLPVALPGQGVFVAVQDPPGRVHEGQHAVRIPALDVLGNRNVVGLRRIFAVLPDGSGL